MRKIVQANIDRFKLLLESETNPEKRAMLIRLLAEEEEKLKQIEARRWEGLLKSAILAPFPPMRRLDVDELSRDSIYPRPTAFSAWEYERVYSPIVHYAHLKVSLGRRN